MTEGLQPIGVCTLQLVMFAISEPHLQHQSLTFVGVSLATTGVTSDFARLIHIRVHLLVWVGVELIFITSMGLFLCPSQNQHRLRL